MTGNASEVSISDVQSIFAVMLSLLTLWIILGSKMFGCVPKKSPKKIRQKKRNEMQLETGRTFSSRRSQPESSRKPSRPIEFVGGEGNDSRASLDSTITGTGTAAGTKLLTTTKTEGPDQADSQISGIQPRNFTRDPKQVQIAMGEFRDRSEYPTMADVLSDWGSTVHKCPEEEEPLKGNTTKSSVGSTKLAITETIVVPTQQTQMPSMAVPLSPPTLLGTPPTLLGTSKTPTVSDPTQQKSKMTNKENKVSSDSKQLNAGGGGEVLKVEPQEGVVSVSGGSIIFNLINLTDDRLVYKTRCTSNQLYHMSPVHAFLEPRSLCKLEVERSAGPSKRDRMEIGYRKAPADAQNAKELFAKDKTFEGVAIAFIVAK